MTSSRQMEQPTRVGEEDRLGAYRALLRGEPERLLVVGRDIQEDLSELAEHVVICDDVRRIRGSAYPSVLWIADADPPEPRSLLRVRDVLEDQGRLVLLDHSSDAASAGSTTGTEKILRSLVRAFSEAGFVVLQEVAPETLGAPAVVGRRDEFVIRAYREGDGPAIRELFAERFPYSRRTPEHWSWKYHDNPWAGGTISLAFSGEDELAVHYAGYAMPFWCRGQDLLGVQIGDTMSAEKFRNVGRGAFSLLARTVRHFFAVHRQTSFEFFYGFNTGPIQRFCQWFIGGSRVEPVSYRRLDLSDRPDRWSSRYRVTRVEAPTGQWDRLFRRVAGEYGFLVRRDRRYVAWRYARCPDESYVVLAAWRFRRLVAWGVFRRQDRRLLWGDALVDPKHPGAVQSLLAAAVDRPELSGTDSVEAWFPDRPGWLHEELRRTGLEPSPHPDRLGFMMLRDSDAELPLGDLYYTMGDGDLF